MTFQNVISCSYKIERVFYPSIKKEGHNLTINCEKCHYYNRKQNNRFFNSFCFNNFIKFFSSKKNINKVFLTTVNGEFELTQHQIKLYSNYSDHLTQLIAIQIPPFKDKPCSKKHSCEKKHMFFIERIKGNEFNDGLVIINPILAYKEILQEIKIYDEIIKAKNHCKDCYEPYLRYLSKIRDILNRTLIIQNFLSIDNKFKNYSEIYTLIFGDNNIFTDDNDIDNLILPENVEIYKSYNKGPYKIKIILNKSNGEFIYLISSINEDPTLKRIFIEFIESLKQQPTSYFSYQNPYKLNYLFQYQIKLINQILKQKYGYLSAEQIGNLADLIVFELLNLNPFMAFLIDNEIEEIFLDSPKSCIYIDHREFGRCRTEISMSKTEIESFKTRIRIEAQQRLDEMKPFLKTEVITNYFHVRVSIQIYPLSIDGFSMSIRKLQKRPITFLDLIKNNTLTTDAAAYLLYNLIHGRCILVIGAPYSGKTTLINSIDMLGKSNWRKLYIEDVIESIDQSAFDIHQVRFQVDITEYDSRKYSNKSFQVKECLHRTPDAIFIGELIHKKSIESFFFLLKLGLRRCLATAHGESPELMIERFIYDDKIPGPLIGNLDIIVQMTKIRKNGRLERKISRIVEIKKNSKLISSPDEEQNNQTSIDFKFIDIFLRNPKNDQLNCVFKSLKELFLHSEVIKKIISLRAEYIDEINYINEMKKIKSFLKELLKINVQNLEDLIIQFHSFWRNLDQAEPILYLSNSI